MYQHNIPDAETQHGAPTVEEARQKPQNDHTGGVPLGLVNHTVVVAADNSLVSAWDEVGKPQIVFSAKVAQIDVENEKAVAV